MKGCIRKKYLILILITMMLLLITGCSNTKDWPTTDEMRNYLEDKKYNIEEDNKIVLFDKEYQGNFILGSKKNDFVIGFIARDGDTAKEVYEYIGKVYSCDVIVQMGSNIYCGTNKALEDAKVNIK